MVQLQVTVWKRNVEHENKLQSARINEQSNAVLPDPGLGVPSVRQSIVFFAPELKALHQLKSLMSGSEENIKLYSAGGPYLVKNTDLSDIPQQTSNFWDIGVC